MRSGIDGGSLLVLAVAIAAIAVYVVVALVRLRYPYELEWLEGVMLEEMRRVIAGLPLYAAPSLQFIPLNYPPLYLSLAAWVARLAGPGLPALRLVSLIASLVTFALLHDLARRETGRPWAGWLAAGLYAASYRVGGAWFDIARPDSLYLTLMLAGVWIVRVLEWSPWSMLGAAVAFTLACLTKQSAPMALAPLLLWFVVTQRARGAVLALATAFGMLASGWWIDRLSGGWFRYYIVEIARRHPFDPALWWHFPVLDLFRYLTPSLALIALMLARRNARPGAVASGWIFALAAGFCASAWALRMFPGGYDNVLMPALASIALLAAVAAGRLIGEPGSVVVAGAPMRAAATARSPRRLAGLVHVLLLIQFGLLAYDPRAQLPRPGDRELQDHLVTMLRGTPGPVLVSSHSYLAMLAGKPPTVHVLPLMDVVKGADGAFERTLWQSMRDSLRAHAWVALILDDRDWLYDEAVSAGYRWDGREPVDPNALWPVTGMLTRPQFLMFPAPRDSLASR